MAYYIFNVRGGDASQVTQLLRNRVWPVRAQEPHRDALAPGDLALVYLAAPERMFIGRAELASPVHDWTAADAEVYLSNAPCGVSLAQFEEWNPLGGSLPDLTAAVERRTWDSGQARLDMCLAFLEHIVASSREVGIEPGLAVAVRDASARALARTPGSTDWDVVAEDFLPA